MPKPGVGIGAVTARQSEVLEFIQQRTEEGSPPTMREIAKAMGIASVNAVAGHVKALKKKGMLTQDEGKNRSLRVAGKKIVLVPEAKEAEVRKLIYG